MISKLHYITQEIKSTTHSALAEMACRGGADWVQLRIKNKALNEIRTEAEKILALCRKYKAKLIINDHPQLALDIGANGVHLGKEDMDIATARRLLGSDFIIGATANSFDDIAKHAANGADYIGLGPYRFTNTKEKLSPVLGLDGYRNILQSCKEHHINIPIIAIGGIQLHDVKPLLNTGVFGIAIASAINLSNNPEALAREWTKSVLKEELI